jgi:RNA polymerase sigma factor (sigma-70 family)
MSETDLQLLERYTRERAEDSFTEIVRRHLNLVYSVALRQVRSTHVAEEVTQSVFADLARQAAGLAANTVLPAWLYQVTRRTALDAIRHDARRQLREQVASEITAMNAIRDEWSQIEPMLEEAMDVLNHHDRAAVVLRYFENKPFREVGDLLGTSEEAARKRVSRALEQLRQFFSRRGASVGTSSLAVLISAHAVQTAPAGLLSAVASAVLSGTSVATTAVATKAIIMTTLQKTVIITAMVATAGTGIYEARQASISGAELSALKKQTAPLKEQNQDLLRDREETATKVKALQEEHSRLNSQLAGVPKLRAEISQLRRELSSLKSESNHVDHTPGAYITREHIAFVGYGTPEAALESMCWANLNGTYEDLVASLAPGAAAEELKDSRRRAYFETVKGTLAQTYKGLQIVAKKLVAEDRVELKFKNDHDSSINQVADLQHILNCGIQTLVKVGAEWKLDGLPRSFDESWEAEGQIQRFTP